MGAGSAAIVTTSVSMITDVFPITHRGGAIGLQTMCTYIGLAAGPPLGGILNDVFGWHSLFLMIVPIAVLAVVFMSMFRDDIRPDEGGTFDSRGSVLYGIGIMLSMLGMVNMSEVGRCAAWQWGWRSSLRSSSGSSGSGRLSST